MNLNFDFNSIKEEITHPQDVSDMFSAEDIQSNKWAAVVATVQPLFFIPLIATPQSGFGKFYANQGLILLVMGVILGIVAGIITAVLGLIGTLLGLIPYIGVILAALVSLLAILIDTVLGAVGAAAFLFLLISALQGKARYIPIVGKLFTVFN